MRSKKDNCSEYYYIEDQHFVVIRPFLNVRRLALPELLRTTAMIFILGLLIIVLTVDSFPNLLRVIVAISLLVLLAIFFFTRVWLISANHMLSYVIAKHGVRELKLKDELSLAWEEIRDFGIKHNISPNWHNSPISSSAIYFLNAKLPEDELYNFLAKGVSESGDTRAVIIYFKDSEEADRAFEKVKACISSYNPPQT